MMDEEIYENAAFYKRVMQAAIAMSEARPNDARCQCVAMKWIARSQIETTVALLTAEIVN